MIGSAHHLIREDDLILQLTRVQRLSYGSALADLFCQPPQALAKKASKVLMREVTSVGPSQYGEDIYLLGAAIEGPRSLPQHEQAQPETHFWVTLLQHFHAS